jgi:copper transport protein
MRRWPFHLVAPLLLAGLWLLATGPAAAAHGNLRSSEPAGGASLQRAPHAVALSFTEAPDVTLSSIRVLDATGHAVAGGRPEAVPGRPLELRVPLHGLRDGTYTVSWRTISAVDGHPTAGTFAFGVGVGGPVLPPAQAVAAARATPPPSPLAVAGRWAYYWGLTLLLGAAAAGLLVFDRRLPGRPGPLLGLAVVAAAAGLAAMVVVARADADVSFGRLLGSTTGVWLAWRAVMLAGAAGAAVGLLLAGPGKARPLVVLGVAAAGGMLVHALAGHAAGPSSLRLLNLAAQWVHLLAVGVWIGGLAWLLAGLRGRARTDRRAVAVRFSKLAGASLGAVVVTGLARSLDELGGWRALLDSGFGRALGVKLALFAGLLLLGALNRYRLVPALQVPAGRRAAGRLRRSVRGELWLAAGVLLAAALLSELPPGASGAAAAARRPAAPPMALQATGSDYATSVRVTLTVSPGAAGPNSFQAAVSDYDSGDPLPARRVELTGTPVAQPGLASARLKLAKAADGSWQGKGPLLSIGGRWSLVTIVEAAGGGVSVPLQLDVPGAGPAHRDHGPMT